jgi:hypothetical protein
MRRRLVLEYSKLPPKQMELRTLGCRRFAVSTEGSNRVKRIALLGGANGPPPHKSKKAAGRVAAGGGT